MFVVADQPPVQYQDPEWLLHPPPFRLRNESPLLRVAPDDVDAEGGPVRDDLVLEALVDQGLTDRAAGRDGDLVEQSDAGGVVVDARGQHSDGDDQADDIHGQSPLAARHPLRGVPARRVRRDPCGHPDTLGIQDHQGRVL